MRNICLQGIVHPFILYHTITSSFCQYFFRNFYFFLWKRPWRDPPPRRKAPLARISAKEEDLGETRLLRRGRSLQTSPGETFPGASPPVLRILYCKYSSRGPVPGNFFWGRRGLLLFAVERWRTEHAGEFLLGQDVFLERQRTGADGKQKVGNYIGLSRPARYLPTDHFQRPVPRGPPPRPPRRRPPFYAYCMKKRCATGGCAGDLGVGVCFFLRRTDAARWRYR